MVTSQYLSFLWGLIEGGSTAPGWSARRQGGAVLLTRLDDNATWTLTGVIAGALADPAQAEIWTPVWPVLAG